LLHGPLQAAPDILIHRFSPLQIFNDVLHDIQEILTQQKHLLGLKTPFRLQGRVRPLQQGEGMPGDKIHIDVPLVIHIRELPQVPLGKHILPYDIRLAKVRYHYHHHHMHNLLYGIEIDQDLSIQERLANLCASFTQMLVQKLLRDGEHDLRYPDLTDAQQQRIRLR